MRNLSFDFHCVIYRKGLVGQPVKNVQKKIYLVLTAHQVSFNLLYLIREKKGVKAVFRLQEITVKWVEDSKSSQ